MVSATAQAQPMLSMQGIAIPATSVNPKEFRRRTRRHIQQEGSKTYDVNNPTMTFELRKSDILAEVVIRVTGSVTITPGTGTVNSTARWPYDFLKAVRFAANGASNLVNASGLKLKVRDFIRNTDLTDRGVSQTIGASSRSQGTLSTASESWGVGSAVTGLSAGTYNFDFEIVVPVAEDMTDLAGAIFLQTSTADLTLALDFESQANLFTTTGNGAFTINTTTVQVWTTKFNIPVGPDGQIVVPDLSLFHSIIQSNSTSIAAGSDNETRVVGQGAGKQLLRAFYQIWSGTPAAPLAMNDTNYGLQAWRYATNETPDQYVSGGHMRNIAERRYSTDIGGLWGFGCHEFASQDAFRDTVDLGTTAELRLIANIPSGVSLTNPRLEYVLETLYSSGAAA